MAADRNKAIEKAIQPMLDMLEQQSVARQQTIEAQASQQRAELLKALLPTQMNAAGQDYQEARAAEEAKAGGQSAAQQQRQRQQQRQAAIPKAQPINVANPTGGLGQSSAQQLNQMVQGGAAVQSGGAGGQLPPSNAPPVTEAPSGRWPGMPGQTVTTGPQLQDPLWKQILRAQAGLPQQYTAGQSIKMPEMSTLVDKGATMLVETFARDPNASPMSNKQFKEYMDQTTNRWPWGVAGQVLNQAVGQAKAIAAQERQRRAIENNNIAQAMKADGATGTQIQTYLTGLRDGNMSMMMQGLGYNSIGVASAQAEAEWKAGQTAWMEQKLAHFNGMAARRSFWSYVNPVVGMQGGPGGHAERTADMLLSVSGMRTESDPHKLRDRVFKDYIGQKGIIMKEPMAKEAFLRSFMTDFMRSNEIGIDRDGYIQLVNLDEVRDLKDNPAVMAVGADELSRDIMLFKMGVEVGGLTPDEMAQTELGTRIMERFDKYGINVAPSAGGNYVSFVSARDNMADAAGNVVPSNPFIKDSQGALGEGMAPVMDAILVGMTRVADHAIESGQDVRLGLLGWSAKPIPGFNRLMDERYWEAQKAGLEPPPTGIKEPAEIEDLEKMETVPELKGPTKPLLEKPIAEVIGAGAKGAAKTGGALIEAIGTGGGAAWEKFKEEMKGSR